MGKKCIPGIICLENMTLFLLFFLCLFILFIYFQYSKSVNKPTSQQYNQPYNQSIIFQPTSIDQSKLNTTIVPTNPIQNTQPIIAAIIPTSIIDLANRMNANSNTNPMNDVYSPPLKDNSLFFPTNSGDERGIPINMKTRGLNMNYSQIGILTRTNHSKNGNEMILPLMGRKNMSRRDKWQYYTMTTTGNMNTKLPVSSNGRSCTSEYGCDEINNGDIVYVEGYNDTFKATVYENSLFSYIPF
jgi:hypothetical protein